MTNSVNYEFSNVSDSPDFDINTILITDKKMYAIKFSVEDLLECQDEINSYFLERVYDGDFKIIPVFNNIWYN